MPFDLYFAYVLACVLITLVPGPTVTLIVANSLRHGMRAGLLNVAGTQLGLALMMLTLVVGLSSVIASMGWWFDWLRYLGARLPRMAGLQAAARAGVDRRSGSRRAGALLPRRRVRLVSHVSGGFLIGGGIWLALARSR